MTAPNKNPESDPIFNSSITDIDFCVLDVETTGMSSYYNRVIEIGIVKISGLKIKEKYHTLINPGTEIPYFITQLTGIKNQDVYDAPYFDEIINKVVSFIDGSVIVAHNAQFDISFLKQEFHQCGIERIKNPVLCTLKLARRLYPQLKSKSLGSLVKNLGITQKNAHRALGDATATAKLLLKMIDEINSNQNITSVSDLLNYQYAVVVDKGFKLIKKKLLNDFLKLPDLPGVYFFKNSKDEVIYVGKAKSLKDRVKSYFSSSAPRKTRSITRQASKIDYQLTNSELTALLREAEMIKLYDPKHNVQLKKYGQTYFIRINKNLSFPSIEACTKFSFDGQDYFGPYSKKETVDNLIDLVKKTFSIKECNEKEFLKGKECYLSQIERCSAPCINKDIKEEYANELNEVYDFLSGKNQTALNRLVNKMKSLSEKKKYEEAAQVRDLVNLILKQIHKSSIISEPINSANILILVNENNNKDFLLLLSGKLIIKNNLLEEDDLFETAIDDYYNNTISLFHKVDKKDLERIKITLSWIIRNRTSVKIYYLKDYSSASELFKSISQTHFIKPSQAEEIISDYSD